MSPPIHTFPLQGGRDRIGTTNLFQQIVGHRLAAGVRRLVKAFRRSNGAIENRAAVRGHFPVLLIFRPLGVDQLQRQEFFGKLEMTAQQGVGVWLNQIADFPPLPGNLRADSSHVAERFDIGNVKRHIIDSLEAQG